MSDGERAGLSGDGPAEGAPVRFALLGPVRVTRAGQPLGMGSPQQRAVLAVLLLRGGRHVAVEELVDAVWGEDPPRDATGTIRTYVSRLRRALGPDADLLRGEAGGYAVHLHPGAELDVQTATRLAAEADAAHTAGDPERAGELRRGALDLWDGEPLAGLPGPYAERQRTRLAEWRLSLLEAQLALDVEVGRRAEAISELTALTAAHPLRERFRELLMLALYRSGRQAEALAVYTDTRRQLTDELGVEPGPELAALQQRILRGTDQPAPASVTASVAPAQLPATLPDFTGRGHVVEELGKQLVQAPHMVMAVSSVSGIGGVGKTTLAVHVAHAARESFPDGQLYVDLQGWGPSPADPAGVLGSFLRALNVPDADIPETLTERAALYRSVLAGRRVLALLDNARDAAQVRPLLPGTEGCAALITSRARMAHLVGAHHVDLDVMNPDEALLLFTRIVGADRVEPHRGAAMDVVAACGFLPLAIRIAASRLAARRTWTVAVLARKLSDEHRRLDELQVGDLAVKATFELGYGQLEPEQARAFRLLGLVDGPDVSLSAAAAVLDRTEDDAEELLEDLVDTSLLESAAPGRYRYHDLLRLFARTCAEREEPPGERGAAQSRLLDFYLATAARVYELDRPGDNLTSHLAPVEYRGLSFADRHTAQDWRLGEADCLLATARQLASERTLARAVDLLMVTADLAESGTYSHQFARVAGHLLTAAQRSGDPRSEGRAHDVLSASHIYSGRFEQADKHAAEAMRLAHASGDPVICGHAASDRGIIADLQGRSADAATHLEDALVAYRTDGNLSGEATALSNLSRMHGDAGRSTLALDLAKQALAIHHKLGPSFRMANCLYALGIALTVAGRADDALTELDAARKLFLENRMHLWYGMTHFRMAEAHLTVERPAEAARYAEQALSQLRGMGGDWHRGSVLTVLGRALDELGQADRARACLAEARDLQKSGSTQAPQG
ncbi:BTAD domain-containing putative transcriptional regulator [Streptomyces sp. WMMC500]|uniref:AfsR/SARP family transcriptional regulator n=1 Tax=Streptomyces sp. WMMC500 TaxID=3015154 RepID=UPI00248CB49E|nr:BTAD domain-containing putative transcriptional regulator [Streptomyces sp. WMMC500]WBB58676.1 BTAD domain-containing putative transcriptional regulator [Streptomyces sp. WMMC500]